MLLFSTVKLPFPAYCDSSVIGLKFPFTLGGLNGVLHFPRHSSSIVSGSTFSYPIDQLIEPTEFLIPINKSSKFNWGQCISNDGICSVNGLYISVVADISNVKELGDHLSEITTDFIERFILFIQILGKFSIDEVTSNSNTDTSKPVFFYLDNHSKVAIASRVLASCSFQISSIKSPINDLLVNESLKYVSASKKPHLAHSILRDAYYHFNKGDYRRAILDATTSVEIAVSNKISNILKLTHNHNNESIKFNIKNYNGLKKKSDFLFTIYPELKKITTQKVIEVLCKRRNESIHEGIPASKTVATKIIEISQKVVHHLCAITE